MLDLTAYTKALAALEEAVHAHADKLADGFIRDACIQRFEYCYDFSHKILRRYLQQSEPDAEAISALAFPELIRLGWKRGLLAQEWAVWRRFRAARNITSHTYDATKAAEVLAEIPGFLAEAMQLGRMIASRQTAR